MKRVFLLFFLWAADPIFVKAQSDDGLAYGSGEELKYIVSYRAKLWPNTEMGIVTMETSSETVNSIPTLRIRANATMMGMFRWFYKLDDTYNTWISRQTLLSILSSADIREGDYRFSSYFNYDWDDMMVQSRYRNHRFPEDTHKKMALVEGCMDGVALFYTLRSSDMGTFALGEERVLNLLLEDTVRQIRYKYFGPEQKKIPGLGELNTLKFSCQLVTSSGSGFEDGSEFFLWVSNDRNKVPVYVESPIRVGSIRARLESYKNLKYPEDGVLQ